MRRSLAAQQALTDCFNRQCSYCKDEMVLEYGRPNSITFDHVIPKSKGGKSKVAACFNCNSKKGNKSLFTFLLDMYGEENSEQIQDIYYDVTSRIHPSERLRLKEEQYGIYLGMRMGPACNPWEYRRSPKAAKKPSGSTGKTRLPVQKKLFGND